MNTMVLVLVGSTLVGSLEPFCWAVTKSGTGTWRLGDVGTWGCGDSGRGDVGTRGRGDVGTWGLGDVGTRGLRDSGTRGCVNSGTWGRGDTFSKYRISEMGQHRQES